MTPTVRRRLGRLVLLRRYEDFNRQWITALAVVLVTAFAASCGNEENDQDSDNASTDVQRYCELTAGFERAGAEIFRQLEQDPNATPEDFAQAEKEFVRQNEDELQEFESVAPPEIEDEVDVLLAGIRARGGLEQDPPSPQDSSSAERAIKRFERENCSKPE